MADGEEGIDDLRSDFARYVISPGIVEDLRKQSEADSLFKSESPEPTARVIIELNADFPGGVVEAKNVVRDYGRRSWERYGIDFEGSDYFIFAWVTEDQLRGLANYASNVGEERGASPIYKIWRDERLRPLLTRSVRTIKADACLTAYGANGEGIVVAVADSGIDETHRHFELHETLQLPRGLEHKDFTERGNSPLTDELGHGTHVAGIIAGRSEPSKNHPHERIVQIRDETDTVKTVVEPMGEQVVQGVAPQAKLMSLKVLDADGNGYASGLIRALEYIAEVNHHGRFQKVHVVNLSLGYPFDAEWFAAGHSPLCTVVNRLSRSGVVVVAAAGNDGSILQQTEGRSGRQRVGVDQSINDPGNADEAITVGATHADSPHRYGVSYFSSRGPTTDGRVKPDLVAPGERIVSCAAPASSKFVAAMGDARRTPDANHSYFREESGTSMAAPHVAGAIACFLSIRREFIGRPERVKEIFVSTCTDLGRKRDFQGAGLLDLMRAIQSV